MTNEYYLILPDEKIPILIGTESFSNFWPELGFTMLVDMVENNPELLEHVTLIDDKKKHYTLTEFFDIFTKRKLKLIT
jgi:hypothetical protein